MDGAGGPWPEARRCTGPCRTGLSRRAVGRSRHSTASVPAPRQPLAAARRARAALLPRLRTAADHASEMIRSLCSIALGVLMTRCYSLQPAMGAVPEPGAEV